MSAITTGSRSLLAATMRSAAGGHYVTIAVIGVVCAALGLGMIFNVRGVGERGVDLMIALGTALGAENQGRRVAARKRLFYIAWGAMALSFGIAALLIAVLH